MAYRLEEIFYICHHCTTHCFTSFNEEIHYRVIHHTPTFQEFYAEELFQEIDQFIGLPKSSYRVASIGLHPAVSQYNGFYTLDTYNNFYPLTYKYEFRKIITKELEKSGVLRRYLTNGAADAISSSK